MEHKPKFKRLYMDLAKRIAQESYAQRKKVGAVAVSPQDVIIYSYNGTAQGDDNACEIEIEVQHEREWNSHYTTLVTKPEVLHAEANIVAKAAREGVSLKGSIVYVTCAPCLECAKLLKQAGVAAVYYNEVYRKIDGVDYLNERSVECRVLE